jgi:hypothetical protein
MNTRTLEPKREAPSKRSRGDLRSRYLFVLNAAFVLFNSTRLLTYLPTMWAVHVSGNSSQHSLLTWIAWAGANASMAGWVYENNGQRVNKLVIVSLGNATMCLAMCVLIGIYRWS